MMRVSSNFKNSGNVYKPGVSLSTSQGLLGAFCPDNTVVSLAFRSPSQLQGYFRVTEELPRATS